MEHGTIFLNGHIKTNNFMLLGQSFKIITSTQIKNI
jgi:hypothetical protein